MKNKIGINNGIFFYEKPIRLLLAIERSNRPFFMSQVAKKINTTYTHVCLTLDEFEKIGLTTSKKVGRKRIIELTDKGHYIASCFEKIVTFK